MKISVITINFNNQQGLEKTIFSVIKQTYLNIEYIIIDGGSTDGSLEIIKKHQEHITYWVSEKDKGIYHAMNKGVEVATGEYLLMLNSGDYLLNNEIVSHIFKGKKSAQVLYGNVMWQEEIGNEYPSNFPSSLAFRYFAQNSICHQAAFIHKSVHEIVGLYDEDYEITADWKLFLMALCKYNIRFQFIDLVVSLCPRDGLSCDPKNWLQITKERAQLLENEFSPFLMEIEHNNALELQIKMIKSNVFVRILSKLKLITY